MKRGPFIAQREASWKRLAELVAELEALRATPSRASAPAELLPLYRRVCQDLALARRRMYGGALVERLNALVLAARNHVYRDRSRPLASAVRFIARDFPRLVRSEAGFFWLSTIVYLVPLVAMMLISSERPDLLFAAVDPAMVQQFEEMYNPSEGHTDGRSADDAIAMFGFYISNNVGGDIKAFAGGALWGVGTLLFLIYNGLVHGSVFGHVTQIGFGGELWPFVCGHAVLELSGLFVASAAGLRLGAALVAPGRRSRSRALRENGARALQLFLGAVAMTVGAAFIEGFWSASAAAVEVKFAVGACTSLATASYLLLAGRGE